MATINQVKFGLQILSQECDGDKCKVAVGDKVILAGDRVSAEAVLDLAQLGWEFSEFGWEIHCE